MTEYECGFTDGIKSKVSAELTPTLIDISKTMSEMLIPVISTALENALNDNNAIPAAGVQPVKRGRWESPVSVGSGIKFCSVCGKPAIIDEFGAVFLPDYCPNCGARMDGERNG